MSYTHTEDAPNAAVSIASPAIWKNPKGASIPEIPDLSTRFGSRPQAVTAGFLTLRQISSISSLPVRLMINAWGRGFMKFTFVRQSRPWDPQNFAMRAVQRLNRFLGKLSQDKVPAGDFRSPTTLSSSWRRIAGLRQEAAKRGIQENPVQTSTSFPRNTPKPQRRSPKIPVSITRGLRRRCNP